MNPLLDAARDLQSFFTSQGWGFCFIGGLALPLGRAAIYPRSRCQPPCGFGQEDEFSGPLLTCGYLARIPDAADFARRNRVLLLAACNGVPIDIALAALPFENLVVQRSSLFDFERGALRTCSAEDLIVRKLFAFRPRDLLDVETVGRRTGWIGTTSRRIWRLWRT